MQGFDVREVISAAILIGSAWAAPSAAQALSLQSVDFESPAYAAERTFAGVDQWTLAADLLGGPADNFKVQAGAGGKWAHVLTTGTTALHRPFPAMTGILDVRWKWRALSDSAHFCLGIAGASLTARGGNRGMACLEPYGALSAQGAGTVPTASAETWKPGTWHYMRMVLDNSQGTNKFALYIAEDSLRAGERLVLPATTMGGSGAFTRLVLQGEAGNGYVDVDDISWEATAVWLGNQGGSGPDADSVWSAARNWNGNTVPDSLTHVVFTAGAGGCLLDGNVSVKSITVAPSYKGTLNLGQQTLTVDGKADFTGGNYFSAGNGRIRFSSPRGHSLTGPESGRILAPVRHDGNGPLRLDGRPLFVADLDQLQGTFDFNGFDLIVLGNLTVKNGRPATLRNLDGRSISVGRAARLEGASKDTLLGLSTAPQGWSIAGSPADSVQARFAVLGNARANLTPGYAYQSVDAGGTTNWIFSKQTLARPTASPAGGSFTDSVAVRLAPPAEAPQATLYYFIGALGPFRFADSLVLRESATLKAIAISGSQYSDTAQWEFRRRLEAPRAAPRTRSFPDTLRVSFTSRVGDASIRYTADGSDPTPASPPFPAQGLLLDSTTVIKAIAVKGSDVSAIASETYTLVPDAPSASPRGGDYGSSITVQLSSRSARAAIYFTLDGTTPGPERGLPAYSVPFRLDTSAALKAVAVAGQGANMQRSAYLIENYTFIRPGSRVLGPGQRLDLSSNYSLVNPLPGAAPVDVEVLAADGLKNLKGFRDILFGIRLSVPDGSAAFPKVVFNAPAGETRLLYSLNPSGTARFLTAGDTSEITAPGTYFMAVDTLAPTITYSGEPFTEEDSTRLIVSIQDNVSNLLLDLERSDKPEAGFTGREITNAMLLTTSLKNPEGALRPLTIRLKVDDHSRKTLFPADGDAYPLAQRSTKPVRTPAAFRIGSSADNPWDLIAIPLALEPPLTLAQLRKNNSAPGLEGVSLNAATGAYRRLDENEPLPPGAAVWMAAPSSLPSMLFPALQTAGHRGSAGYRLTLRKGWNLVSNPTLDTLYWPVTRAYPESYDASRLKGLHAWNAGTREYEPAELLDPWRGYFAYYKGGRDTTVDLLSRPVPAPAPSRTGPPGAKSAAGSAGFTFRLSLQGWGRGSGAAGLSLRLGATATAENGLGVEDEPQPPSPKDDGPRLFSDRGNLRLGTDLVRWTQGNLYAWKVVAGLPARADSSAGSMRILGSALPEGHGAWAVSRKRGLRFPLGAGAEARPGPGSAEGIPMYPGFTDSLEVIAGPIAELEARLGTIPLAAGAFAARVSAWPGSLALDLRLPRAARLRMSLWSLDGRILERATLDLPQGIYHLVRNRGGRGYAPGLYVLALEWAEGAGAAGPRGSEGPRNLSLKIAIP